MVLIEFRAKDMSPEIDLFFYIRPLKGTAKDILY